MNRNYLQNTSISHFFSKEPSLMGSGPAQQSSEAPKTSNNIIVLSSDDDDNTTPKSRTKSIKSSVHTLKRTQSQLTDRTIQRRSTKSVLNSNFSLEDHPEPESAETDFNSPVASSQKHQASKLKQQQKQSSSSQRKVSQVAQINQSSSQEDNTLRKKSFFEELEEIAFSLLIEPNKKVKIDDSTTQSLQSLPDSSSSNLISLYPSQNQSSSQQFQQSQTSQQQQQLQLHSQYQSKQLDLIQEEDEEQQIANNQSLKQRKQRQQRAPRAAPQKKQAKINQKQTQRSKKIAQAINNNSTNNYQINNTINNNQTINCANTQINFPLQPKTILLNQNTFKFQEAPKKIQPPRAVFAEEVYLKSISQEGSIKLQKFPCFRESDLQIPTQFSNLIQQQFSDDDKCSGDELLEKAVNYMHKKLVASTIEQNPSAVIPDAEKNFTIRDIKIDRDSEEEDEEEQEEENQNSYHSNHHSQYSPYGRQNKNNFLSDDEDENESDNDDENSN